jgi:hypothetical protein
MPIRPGRIPTLGRGKVAPPRPPRAPVPIPRPRRPAPTEPPPDEGGESGEHLIGGRRPRRAKTRRLL